MKIDDALIQDLVNNRLTGQQEQELFKAILKDEKLKDKLIKMLSENNKMAYVPKEPTSFSSLSKSGKPMTHISETITKRQRAKLGKTS
jgi:hypothetical protein